MTMNDFRPATADKKTTLLRQTIFRVVALLWIGSSAAGHTAGLPNNVSTDRALRKASYPALADSTLEEMMNRLDVVPLIYPPGKGWHYSFAADVVARLVEIGSGRPLDKAFPDRQTCSGTIDREHLQARRYSTGSAGMLVL